MNDYLTSLTSRKNFCSSRLKRLKGKIKNIDNINENYSDFCIYATGSYGRFEATQYSDLDLFFLNNGKISDNKVSRITKTLIDAEIIKQTRALNFGEFSNDGQYLEILHIDDMLDAIGCPADDYQNYFTARMLLLLESFPLHNKDFYDEILKKIISAYFRDYHDHNKEFKPIFLVNDILRFWKTLCLNYEHRRNRPVDDRNKKNSTHLKNLKLKFSRMITCFATIIILIKKKQVITQTELLKILHLTPLERLDRACGNKHRKLYEDILKDYVWFLEITGRPQKEVIQWIGNRRNRDRAFQRGRNFGVKVYKLLNEVADPSDLRYLII